MYVCDAASRLRLLLMHVESGSVVGVCVRVRCRVVVVELAFRLHLHGGGMRVAAKPLLDLLGAFPS